MLQAIPDDLYEAATIDGASTWHKLTTITLPLVLYSIAPIPVSYTHLDVYKRQIVNNDLNVNFLDLRYAGWAPWEGAWTEAGVSYAMPNPTDEQKKVGNLYDPKNGVMLTAEMSQYFADSRIYEKLVLQYADKGLAQNMISQGGGWYDVWHLTDDAKGYRVILTGDIPMGEKFSVNHVFTYGKGEKMCIRDRACRDVMHLHSGGALFFRSPEMF